MKNHNGIAQILVFSLVVLGASAKTIWLDVNSSNTQQGCGNSLPEACKDLNAALFFSSPGDTITVMPGTYKGAKNTNQNLPHSLTIQGNSDPENVIFNLGGNARWLTISNLNNQSYIFNVRVVLGNSSDGGVLLIQNSQVAFNNCKFENNTAENGGAMQIYNSNITISNTDFFYNIGFNLGVIGVEQTTSLELVNVNASYNFASFGGFIWSQSSITHVSNSYFFGNEADQYGGTFAAQSGSRITVEDSFISNSTAIDRGGVAWITGALIELSNTWINASSSGTDGGAIFVSAYGGIRIQDSNVTYCDVFGYGGAIWIDNQAVVFSNNTVYHHNIARFGGGAFYVGSYSKLYSTDDSIYQNEGTDGGAFFYQHQAKVVLTNANISYNYADANGGAIYCSDSTVTISNCTMEKNKADMADDNLHCSTLIGYTICNVLGDKPWLNMCASDTSSTSGDISNIIGQIPPIAIAGIVLGGLGLLICIAAVIMMVRFKRQQKAKATAVFEPLSTDENAPEPTHPEATSLMQDYDN